VARTQDDSLVGLKFDSLPRFSVLAGPAGIGKTRFLLENFSELLQKSPRPFERGILYLLPSAEHRERVVDLMLRKDLKVFFGERVTTFNRLMQERLKTGDFSLITDAERQFLLSEILSSGEKGYFSDAAVFPGLLQKISEFIGELKESLVPLDSFRQRAKVLEKKRPEFSEKYRSLVEIYTSYESKLEALGIRDYRDSLSLLKSSSRPRLFFAISF
jgi:ATP-dependent helicase/DNAse subunit B